jgi:regulatory helix-turn-helix LysR family protein
LPALAPRHVSAHSLGCVGGAPGFNLASTAATCPGARSTINWILIVSVSFKTLDLNLLKVFDAVMEERSVLRASQKVALSQSAVSHSLARLREMLEDDLFVRTATGMQPTARALTMAPQVRDALRALEAAVELPTFVPATSTKQFTLAANDFTTMVLASPLLKILGREAPSIDLTIKPVTPDRPRRTDRPRSHRRRDRCLLGPAEPFPDVAAVRI